MAIRIEWSPPGQIRRHHSGGDYIAEFLGMPTSLVNIGYNNN